MSKNKLARFAENETFELLFQHTDYDIRNDKFDLKGKWHQQFFKNDHPIILEVGCGRGNIRLRWPDAIPNATILALTEKAPDFGAAARPLRRRRCPMWLLCAAK